MPSILARSLERSTDRHAATGMLRGARPLRLVLLVALSGCGGGADTDLGVDTASLLPANAQAKRGCEPGGRMRTTVYGALDGDVDWSGAALDCEGMPRPDGDGVRLRFAGVADSVPLAFILGVDGIGPEETAAELPTNVTVIEEGEGRFFSTSDLDGCWTDIERHVAVDAESGRYAIDGTLYCISPLAEVNGTGSVSIPELSFSGLVDWGPS